VRERVAGKRSNLGVGANTHKVTRAELVPLRLVILLSPLLRTRTQCLCIGDAYRQQRGRQKTE
jgi:hypothetical protein